MSEYFTREMVMLWGIMIELFVLACFLDSYKKQGKKIDDIVKWINSRNWDN